MKSLIVVCFVLLTSVAAAGTTTVLSGRASIIDADTIEIHGERVRFLDIDAPEGGQTCTNLNGLEWRCGQQASFALADWIAERTVTCEGTKHDRYGRLLARCIVASQDIAVWLAESGWVVPYRDCKCETVREAAVKAKTAKIGIWSGTFVLPWEWRKAH